MTGSVILRLSSHDQDGSLVSSTDTPMSWEDADKRAGMRLDRRKAWAFIPSHRDEDMPELCELIRFSQSCSGCDQTADWDYSERGSGCAECGYTGRRLTQTYVPYVGKEDND